MLGREDRAMNTSPRPALGVARAAAASPAARGVDEGVAAAASAPGYPYLDGPQPPRAPQLGGGPGQRGSRPARQHPALRGRAPIRRCLPRHRHGRPAVPGRPARGVVGSPARLPFAAGGASPPSSSRPAPPTRELVNLLPPGENKCTNHPPEPGASGDLVSLLPRRGNKFTKNRAAVEGAGRAGRDPQPSPCWIAFMRA